MNENPITRDELRSELRALRWQFFAALGVTAGIIRLDVPDPVTITAIAGVVLKAILAVRAAA